MRSISCLFISILSISGSACGDDSAGSVIPDGSADASASSCSASIAEADLGSPAGPGFSLQGPGVDPATGGLMPRAEGFVVSVTYLALRPEAGPRFGELVGPILADFETREGLLAVGVATSESCGTARTFTVWEDEASMFAFVTSDVHSAAVAAVGEVSRGGSIVTSWSAPESSAVTLDEGYRRLAMHDGPEY